MQQPADDFRATVIGSKTIIDLFYITNELTYIILVDEFSQLVMVQHLKRKSTDVILEAIRHFKAQFQLYNHKLLSIYSDHEQCFVSLEATLATMGIKLILCAPQNHMGLAEVKIKQIKNKFLAIIHSLPYVLPFCFSTYLIYWITQSINTLASTKHDSSPRLLFTNGAMKACNLTGHFGQIAAFTRPNRDNKLVLVYTQYGMLILKPYNPKEICFLIML